MNRTTLKGILSAIMVTAGASAASAQDFPDMVGVWKGQADGIVLGNPDHFQGLEDTDQVRVAGFDITITISNQDGRFIWGTISGGGTTEPWLGSLWSDGSGYRAVDGNGHVIGRIISENEIENCYTHTGETIVASCAFLSRQ